VPSQALMTSISGIVVGDIQNFYSIPRALIYIRNLQMPVIDIVIQMSRFQNVPFYPISASGSNFNPRNTQCMPVVKIFAFLDLEQTETF
jgi:hypothetical protein